jgi:SagB-type dehydrogenase family enzyme
LENTKLEAMRKLLVFTLLIISSLALFSQKNISLPEPDKTGGMPLMEALANRSTSRAFSTKALPHKQLSNLLWAAWGINRADGKRTAPSAMNKQEIDIYVLLKSGVYLWDAVANQLVIVSPDDVRNFAGSQEFIRDAPVQIILVANLSKMGNANENEKLNTANIDAGYISQNIYLYCASEGLATGARGYLDKVDLAPKLMLKPGQEIIIAHSVGYPKK